MPWTASCASSWLVWARLVASAAEMGSEEGTGLEFVGGGGG